MPDSLQEIINMVLDHTVRIQQIPAPTFAEAQRSDYMKENFSLYGLQEVTSDALGNVFGRLPGTGEKAPVVVSAHLDTVFPEGTDLHLIHSEGQICGPGIGDNSLGAAALFGVLEMLQESPKLPGDVWLVANTCEEGLGDLKGMKAVVDRFGHQAAAYIVLEGMGLGRITHRGLGVQRYRVTMCTQGGHSWAHFGRPSAVLELARFVGLLHDLHLPTEPRTTYNVGVFKGGTSVNVIPSEAHLELDLRSEDVDALKELCTQVEKLAGSFIRIGSDYVSVNLEIIGLRPAGEIPDDHPLVQSAVDSLYRLGFSPQLGIGSTDANVPLSRGIPSVCLGVTTGTDSHTLSECIQTEPVALGLQQVVDVVRSAFLHGKSQLLQDTISPS
jgi:tripeptide aminopeptidase